MKVENATKENVEALACLIDLAGEGLPSYLWSSMMTEETSPLEVGVERALRKEGAFSYKNARIIRSESDVAGMIISYRLDDPYVIEDLDSVPEVVKPLILLESKAPGSWYVNAVATHERHRGKGIATGLLQEAEEKAKEQGINQISLIVSSENIAAKQLYIKMGYEYRESLPVIKYPGCLHGGDWELMTKTI